MSISLKDIDPMTLMESISEKFYASVNIPSTVSSVPTASSCTDFIERLQIFCQSTRPIRVAELGTKLLLMCGEGGIMSGRNTRATAWSAFIVAFETLFVATHPKLTVLQNGERNFLVELCSFIGNTSKSTVIFRLREFLRLLIRQSKKLPWLTTLKIHFKNITSFASEIIQFGIQLSPYLDSLSAPTEAQDIEWPIPITSDQPVDKPIEDVKTTATGLTDISIDDIDYFKNSLLPLSYVQNENIRQQRMQLLESIPVKALDDVASQPKTSPCNKDHGLPGAPNDILPNIDLLAELDIQKYPETQQVPADANTLSEIELFGSLLSLGVDKNTLATQPTHSLREHLSSPPAPARPDFT